jgi:hypothetical protein
MRYLKYIPIVLVAFLIGCATPPEAIPPSYVSQVGYTSFSCKQLGEEQGRLVVALSTASDAQRQARSNDVAGVILLGLPVSSLSGANQASNIGRLKGELEAVQKAMIAKGCANEIISVEDAIQKKSKTSVETKSKKKSPFNQR